MGFETQEEAERWAENMEFRAEQRKDDAMMNNVKLCKGCKHFKAGNCMSPLNSVLKPDYVNGGETHGNPVWYGAQYCREDEKTCGPKARWFEPRAK